MELGNHMIEVRHDTDVCTHAANCVKGLPAVFDANKTPWVNVNGADVTAIVTTIATCPSGALTFELVGKAQAT